jgi:MinD-like ATPase involved in chromosome partitioning or flagellar assembly
MSKSDYQEIIAEYKEQVRVLKEQVNELTDACKAKDAAVKRALQKLEYTTNDLDKANEEMKEKNIMKDKKDETIK